MPVVYAGELWADRRLTVTTAAVRIRRGWIDKQAADGAAAGEEGLVSISRAREEFAGGIRGESSGCFVVVAVAALFFAVRRFS